MKMGMRRGFSLIEMVISIGIIGVSIIAATLIIGTIKLTHDAAYENIAFRIADSKLNELRAGGYAALPAGGPFADAQLASIPQGAASTTVTVFNAKTKEVNVGVSWLGTSSTTRYVSLTTLMTQSGGL